MRTQARRHVAQYIRFLAIKAVVYDSTPSKLIDGVFHCHLLYTRSYQRFCAAAALGTPGGFIHHDPTPRGYAAAERSKAQYANTLRLYTAAFREPPPDDLWPHKEVLKEEQQEQQRLLLFDAATDTTEATKVCWAHFLEDVAACLPSSALNYDPALDAEPAELMPDGDPQDLINTIDVGTFFPAGLSGSVAATTATVF